MATDNINIKIKADVKNAVNGLNKTEKEIKDVKKAEKGFGTGIKVGALAVVAALVAVGKVASKTVKLFAVQEKAQRTLAAAMQQAGTFTQDAYEHNLKYASSLQKISVFGDEAILGVQKMLTNFGAEGQVLDDLTKATLDLAAAKGIDLKSAGDLVAKSFGSSTNAMSRYGVEITGAAGSTERAKMAVEGITKLFGGAAQAEAETFSGKIKSLQNTFGDMMEIIGDKLAPIIGKVADKMKEWVDSGKAFKVLNKIILGTTLVMSYLKASITFTTAPLRMIGVVGHAAFSLVTSSVNLLLERFDFLVKGLSYIKSGFKTATGFMVGLFKDVGDEVTKTQSKNQGAIQKSLDILKNGYKDIKGDVVDTSKEAFKDLLKLINDNSEAEITSIKITGENRKTDNATNLQEQKKLNDQIAADKKKADEETAKIELAQKQRVIEGMKEMYRGAFDIISAYSAQAFEGDLETINEQRQAALDALDEETAQKSAEDIEKQIAAAKKVGDEKKVLELQNQQKSIKLEAEKQAKIDAINAEYDQKEKDRKNSNARLSKGISVVQATIDAIAAGVAAFKSTAAIPIVGPAAAGPAGAAAFGWGMAKAGIMAAMPIPKFADGGSFTTNGPQMFMAGDNPSGAEKIDITPLDDDTGVSGNEYHFHGIQDLAEARNELIRKEGASAWQ